MRLINKYNIEFTSVPVSLFRFITIKLFTIYTLLKIEIMYYHNLSEILYIVLNLMLMYFMITINKPDEILSLLLIFVFLNAEVIYILLHAKLPLIKTMKCDNTSLNIEVNKEKRRLIISVFYKDQFLFVINRCNLTPYVMLPLLNEYIENPNLEEHKSNFIRDNLIISFDPPLKEELAVE